jgi:hypothetical protein
MMLTLTRQNPNTAESMVKARTAKQPQPDDANPNAAESMVKTRTAQAGTATAAVVLVSMRGRSAAVQSPSSGSGTTTFSPFNVYATEFIVSAVHAPSSGSGTAALTG